MNQFTSFEDFYEYIQEGDNIYKVKCPLCGEQMKVKVLPLGWFGGRAKLFCLNKDCEMSYKPMIIQSAEVAK